MVTNSDEKRQQGIWARKKMKRRKSKKRLRRERKRVKQRK